MKTNINHNRIKKKWPKGLPLQPKQSITRQHRMLALLNLAIEKPRLFREACARFVATDISRHKSSSILNVGGVGLTRFAVIATMISSTSTGFKPSSYYS